MIVFSLFRPHNTHWKRCRFAMAMPEVPWVFVYRYANIEQTEGIPIFCTTEIHHSTPNSS